jgi:hypothetical protein
MSRTCRPATEWNSAPEQDVPKSPRRQCVGMWMTQQFASRQVATLGAALQCSTASSRGELRARSSTSSMGHRSSSALGEHDHADQPTRGQSPRAQAGGWNGLSIELLRRPPPSSRRGRYEPAGSQGPLTQGPARQRRLVARTDPERAQHRLPRLSGRRGCDERPKWPGSAAPAENTIPDEERVGDRRSQLETWNSITFTAGTSISDRPVEPRPA